MLLIFYGAINCSYVQISTYSKRIHVYKFAIGINYLLCSAVLQYQRKPQQTLEYFRNCI